MLNLNTEQMFCTDKHLKKLDFILPFIFSAKFLKTDLRDFILMIFLNILIYIHISVSILRQNTLNFVSFFCQTKGNLRKGL